jgi:hypothetical protein
MEGEMKIKIKRGGKGEAIGMERKVCYWRKE